MTHIRIWARLYREGSARERCVARSSRRDRGYDWVWTLLIYLIIIMIMKARVGPESACYARNCFDTRLARAARVVFFLRCARYLSQRGLAEANRLISRDISLDHPDSIFPEFYFL